MQFVVWTYCDVISLRTMFSAVFFERKRILRIFLKVVLHIDSS